jgi:type II secretory pathway pseudopilin PulG
MDPRQAGYTYVGLLIAVSLVSVALAAAGELWSAQARRERELQLLFVGQQFKAAIASYHASTPGGTKQFPRSIDDLLEDRRLPAIKRHLRQPFIDPMTGSREWGLIRGPGSGIVGVYSRSVDAPMKQDNFPRGLETFANAKRYADWTFVYQP